MHLKKAREIIDTIKQDIIPVGELDQLKALTLGMEALERIELKRLYPKHVSFDKLPTETDD